MNQMLATSHTSKYNNVKIILLGIIILLLWACDRKTQGVEPNLDLIYDETPIYSELNTTYPYNFDTFRAVLNQSNYQYTHGTPIAHHGKFENYKSPTFYATENGDLYFTVSKNINEVKVRSELRQVYQEPISREYNTSNGWKTSDSNGNFWISDVRCFKPNLLQSYTWMQVHGIDGGSVTLNSGEVVKSYNYPLIRLTWNRYQYGIYDHIWAVIIANYPRSPKVYEWIDLGPRPDDFFNAEVHIQDNLMKIIINHVLVYIRDMTYWEEEPNYFKAGVYINRYQDGGTAVVAYRNLRFETNDANVTKY